MSNLCAPFVVHRSEHLPLKSLFKALKFPKHFAPSPRILRCKISFSTLRDGDDGRYVAFHDSLSFFSVSFSLHSIMPTVSIIDQFLFDASMPTIESGTPVTDGKHSLNSRLPSRDKFPCSGTQRAGVIKFT